MKPSSGQNPVVRMQRLLVPYDFSPCAQAALEHAIVLAVRFDAVIELLNVIEPLELRMLEQALVTREVQGAMRQRAGQALAELVKDKAGAGTVLRWHVKPGKPWQTIVRFARKTGTDLIVMGTHGRSGLKRVMLGSVAERVVRHAGCPVLTVPNRS